MKLKLTDAGLLRHQAYVDGEWIDADDGATLSVKNPANGEEIIAIASVGQAETRRAIEAAEIAMKDWQQRPAKERAQILRRWFDLMMAHQEDLHRLVGSFAQQIEMNRALLPMIDELATDLPFKTVSLNRNLIGKIRDYVEVGAKG